MPRTFKDIDKEQMHALQAAWTALSACGWLAGRSDTARNRLFEIARLCYLARGQILYRHGDVADGVYGLVRGSVDIAIPRIDGQEVVVHRAEAGFWIGDLALFARQERLVTLRAATACTFVHLPQTALDTLIAADYRLLSDFYALTHQNVATMIALLANLAISGAENRVAQRLIIQQAIKTDPDGFISLGQDSLAELVALSVQSVRRALRQLEARGFIETGYGRIRILDEQALARLCGYTSP